MKKIILIALCFVMIYSMEKTARANILTILPNYNITNNLDDVVHIGDQSQAYYHQPISNGVTVEFVFDISDLDPGGQYYLSMTSWEANPELGYLDYVYLNGYELGYLSGAYDSDLGSYLWVKDTFAINNSMLNLSGNSLTIESALLVHNYDDVDITNIFIENKNISVPEPATTFTLTSGLFVLVLFRSRFFLRLKGT